MDCAPLSLSAHLVLHSVDFPTLALAFVVLWMLIFGGSIGSFLNVVVHRLPLGLSLVRPRSRCPRCETPILARDNIPVFGWLLLRGRCRACRTWISARYPLVEFTTAAAFLILAMVEPIGSGWNLPVPRVIAGSQPLWISLFYHFALCCVLLGAGLITLDGEAVPRRLWSFLLTLGFGVAAFWPRLRPVGVTWIDRDWGPLAVGLGEGAVGIGVGLLLGAVSWPAASSQVRGRSGHLSAVMAMACVGTMLGHQAAAVLAVVASAGWAVWQIVRYPFARRGDIPWLLFLTATTFAWIVGWRFFVYHWPAAGAEAPWYVSLAAAATTLVLALAGRTLADSARRSLLSSPVV